ncbi:MAG TPA: FAD-dependent thymidylate synthase [Candidatus Paceibacterota bacterium]
MRVLLHSKSHIVSDIPDFVREDSENTEYADADLTAEEAGRLCYLSWHRPHEKTANNSGYLLNICNQGHYSVLGHSSASFYIDEISRNCTHEIIRHRWFTFSEVSQRYVDGDKAWFASSHPGIREYTEGRDYNAIQQKMVDAKDLYKDIAEYLEASGHTRKEARQAARHVLPGGTETKILMSGNLRAWRDFLAQRLSPHADDEIRAVAIEIYKILSKEFPNSFRDFDSRGLITVERLIARAMDRRDTSEAFSSVPSYKTDKLFVADVKDILKNGLWVLEYDPWMEEDI